MHLLDTYALNCGLKVDKPYIYDLYYPLGIEKYISFQPFSVFPEKQYDFWDEVTSHLMPILEKENVKIVQIGLKDDPMIRGCIWTQGTTKISQVAHLIKNGLMHFGIDSFGCHVASGYNKKIVSLYSTNYAENCKPYWSDSKDVKLFEPDRTESKPTFNHEEGPDKSINKVKPEDVANSVLEFLGLEQRVNLETIYFGNDYNKPKIMFVPSSYFDGLREFDHLVFRMDLHFDEEILEALLLTYDKSSIITNKSIDIAIIEKNKDKIQDIVYFIDKNHDIKFVEKLHYLGVNYILVSTMEEKDLNDLKLDYLDYNFIFRQEVAEEKKKEILKHPKDKLKFKSKHKYLKEGKVYNSIAALNAGVEQDSLFSESFINIIDNKDFWLALEDYYIVKELD